MGYIGGGDTNILLGFGSERTRTSFRNSSFKSELSPTLFTPPECEVSGFGVGDVGVPYKGVQ